MMEVRRAFSRNELSGKRYFLFLGSDRQEGFMSSLGAGLEGAFSLVTRVSGQSFEELLYGVDGGVVLVGPQTSKAHPELAVFGDYPTYFRFLDAAKRDGLLIAAVLPEGLVIPGQNNKIDLIIHSELVTGTRNELTNLFDGGKLKVSKHKTVERITLYLKQAIGCGGIASYGELITRLEGSITDLLQEVFGAARTGFSPPVSDYSGLETLAASSEYSIAGIGSSAWVGLFWLPEDHGRCYDKLARDSILRRIEARGKGGVPAYDVGILFQARNTASVQRGAYNGEFVAFKRKVTGHINEIVEGLAAVQLPPLSRRPTQEDSALTLTITKETVLKSFGYSV